MSNLTDFKLKGTQMFLHPHQTRMGAQEEVPLETLNENSPYYNFFTEKNMQVEEEPDDSPYNYLFEEEDNTNNISVISFYNTNEATKNSLVINFEKKKQKQRLRHEPYPKESIKIHFNINILGWTGKSLNDWFNNLGKVQHDKLQIVKKEAVVVSMSNTDKRYYLQADPEAQASQAETPYSSLVTGGKKYIARGGAGGPLVRRISASINNARARQTHERQPNFDLHRSFFLIIWEHFAPNSNIRERPRQYNKNSLNVRLPPIYRDGNRVCSLLLRCVRRGNNIAYSVLFEFTPYIHWSIFYSFDVEHGGTPNVNSGQVSELHFTLNECAPTSTPKTRMFFEYTDYINGLISSVHNDMVARPGGGLHLVSHIADQCKIMEIVSELMLLTMYQLITAKSYATGDIFHENALNMRQNIDSVGYFNHDNQLLNIALQHADLIDCIQQEFRRHPQVNFASDGFINHLKTDINRAITLARPRGGKNINRYLTKINNIKWGERA